MFDNSPIIRSLLGSNNGWTRDNLPSFDSYHTLIDLTLDEDEGEEKGQMSEVNLIAPISNPVHGINGVGSHHNSTLLHPLSGPRTKPLWSGKGLSYSSIKNWDGTTNIGNNRGGRECEDANPTHQYVKETETVNLSLDQLGPVPPKLSTLSTTDNVAQSNVTYHPTPVGSSQERREMIPSIPQKKKMAVGTLHLPNKEICMDPEIKEMQLTVRYGKRGEQVLLKTDLHQFMHLLMTISQPFSSKGLEPEQESSCPPVDSSPFSISNGISDNQRVSHSQPQKIKHESRTLNHEKVTENPIKKVKQQTGVQGVPENSTPKTGGLPGWRYYCHFCNQRWHNLHLLNQHLLIHMMEKPFPSSNQSTTKTSFNTKSNLTFHKRLHDPARRRPFKCDECEKSFVQKQHLARHVRGVHQGVKEFKCLKCEKMFGTETQVMIHHDAVHLGIRHPCLKTNCGKTFSTRDYLLHHQKQFHPKVQCIPESFYNEECH